MGLTVDCCRSWEQELQRLALRDCVLNAAAFEELSRCSGLTYLDLEGTAVAASPRGHRPATAANLGFLPGLYRLDTLRLPSGSIADQLSVVSRLSWLRELHMDEAGEAAAPGPAVFPFSGLSSLSRLVLALPSRSPGLEVEAAALSDLVSLRSFEVTRRMTTPLYFEFSQHRAGRLTASSGSASVGDGVGCRKSSDPYAPVRRVSSCTGTASPTSRTSRQGWQLRSRRSGALTSSRCSRLPRASSRPSSRMRWAPSGPSTTSRSLIQAPSRTMAATTRTSTCPTSR